jgi:hypothetical protein
MNEGYFTDAPFFGKHKPMILRLRQLFSGFRRRTRRQVSSTYMQAIYSFFFSVGIKYAQAHHKQLTVPTDVSNEFEFYLR